MANIVPGFVWTPIDVGNRAARRKGRGLIGHVAVSNSKNLVPSGTPDTRSADWHFYLPKIGPGRQYIDLDLQSWSSRDGNPDTAAFESEGGMGTDAEINGEAWTSDQLISAARILRHMHDTEGVPYQNMGNSLAASRGFAVHRFGIDPWRVTGGQLWSSSRGKLCPGDAKVTQIQRVINLAASGAPLIWGGILPGPVSPVPTPVPVVVPPVPAAPAWDLPAGHYFGNKAGPAKCHGGFYISEQDNVKWIQRKFIALGCVPGVKDWRSGWADGLWEAATDSACRTWFARFRPGQPFNTQIWRDDYAALARL